MAFYDGLLKVIGIDAQGDRNEAAEQELAALRKAQDPASAFAKHHAEGMAGLPDRSLRRVLPGVGDGGMPPEGAERTALVARTLKQQAEQFMERGSDQEMTPPLGRAVREHALTTLTADMEGSPSRSLADVMEERSGSIGKITSNYLAAGRAHETALDSAAQQIVKDPIRLSHLRSTTGQVLEPLPLPNEADRGQGWDTNRADRDEALRWTREALAVEVALARGGALKPQEIVRAAHGNPAQAKLLLDVQNDRNVTALVRVHPNFSVGQKTQPHEMAALVDRFMSTSNAPQMKSREDRDRQVSAQMDMPVKAVGPSFAAAAAMRDQERGASR